MNTATKIWGFLAIAFLVSPSLEAQDWDALLKKSETYRTLTEEGFSFDYGLKEGDSTQAAAMRVFLKPGDPLTVAVKYLAPARYENRRILVGPGGFWLMDKGMNSPLRISPQQMLFGQAAAGDITRVSFSLQYTIVSGEEKADLITLTLEKKAEAEVPFPKVLLSLEKGSARPRIAEFYSLSGQLSKSIRYEKYDRMPEHQGRELLTGFRIINELNKQETLVQLGRYAPVKLSEASFTRAGFGKIP